MKRLLFALLLLASTASAQIELKDGRVWINGTRRDDTVWFRSCFKLANHLTYHWSGQGGGPWGLGSARAWVDEQRALGFDGCRVFLETEGWSECETGAAANDGMPDGCMFGSEPVDKGFWDVDALRSGGRPVAMHDVGRQALRWFFETSQETGFGFELVAIATQKHNSVTQEQQTHVIRQTLAEAYRLQKEFPQANILMSAINEGNAHAPGWTIAKMNLVAVRADRWKHPDGRTFVGCADSVSDTAGAFEPEQWPCGPLIADLGGSNTFDYDVGPEPGKFDMGAVHPERDDGWERFPNEQQKAVLVRDSRGQPWGFTESMYYVEAEDLDRARGWYPGHEDRWTSDWTKYVSFLGHVEAMGVPYFVAHDEKGAGTVRGWPRAETRVDRWAKKHLGGADPEPPPPKVLVYDPIIDGVYRLILARSADPGGIAAYNPWMGVCVAERPLPACIDALELVLFESGEYRERFSK